MERPHLYFAWPKNHQPSLASKKYKHNAGSSVQMEVDRRLSIAKSPTDSKAKNRGLVAKENEMGVVVEL